MTCHECRDQMLEVARWRSAPFVDRAVAAHAAACGECGRLLERERALSAQLRGLVNASADATASAGVEARLMAAFETERAVPSAGGLRRFAWLAAAAGLALSVAASAWWMSGTRQPQPPVLQGAARAVEAPGAVSAPEQVQAARVEPSDGNAGRATVRPPAGSRPSRRPTPRPVQATGFVPLPTAAGLPDFESGEIVRVGISVTALPGYGLEIPSGAQATIQADFLVGQDGQPRAIRLVTADAQDARPRQ